MNRKQSRIVRVIAIVLAVLLTLGVVISALLSFAYAEEAMNDNVNRCELTMEYLGEEQALRMSQRLVYTNTSDTALDRVLFYAPANLFRRQNTLPYDAEALSAAFPTGFLPGGIDLVNVQVNGDDCDWGYQGEAEMFLRVSCALAPGESCVFSFDYYLLLTQNAAFMGVSESDWRLSGFYFAPAALDENNEFILNTPLSFTRYADVPAMDFEVRATLPESLMLAGTGTEQRSEIEGAALWTVAAQGVHDFALHLSLLPEKQTQTASGVALRSLTDVRGAADELLSTAAQAVEICEDWFGPLPFRQIDFVQADYGLDTLSHSSCMWLSRDFLKSGGRTQKLAVYSFIAQQYFGCRAWAHPSSDAWLSDSVSEYLGYLILEELEGHEAYLQALNENLVDSLQLTIPGGLNVTSDASLFTAYEYDIIIRNRGAVVFHELRTAMGREALIAGLRRFYEKGLESEVLTEMDLVDALDEASSGSWEKFLTDWVYNVGDYVNQEIDWLD